MEAEVNAITNLCQAVANLTAALAQSQAENAQLRAALETVIETQPAPMRSRTAAPRGRG